ncbi:MAG: hypothetical protein C7B44_11490 [Sulfobacillus thermosulfidooxidans]|uniref:Uncharacterized protein n=1 Tax=Sulfobacillus thermotolerans TaxID=338644 RepID=A0ABN5GZQ1_9FIRM|nr:hypothetical protein [Sulfobacillus sp. hq2]AUW93845.1 hypothetical protein BXT84_07730 [Sulfobacillus thermotolerans]MCY0908916.1 hypothetical protein [Sulfobacillus thermotolerans]POB11341.1 hypothetical protein CO251_05365 [Sulfobacillus sp. hq2]PSR35963.1 MAG: hypothetical protein C7B44_11490 [Sulfobacillus thermosulfidooxidans]
MGNNFWPHLPLRIPYSIGMAHWWDPMWWIFQIVVMTVLLITLRKVAMDIDRERAEKRSSNANR